VTQEIDGVDARAIARGEGQVRLFEWMLVRNDFVCGTHWSEATCFLFPLLMILWGWRGAKVGKHGGVVDWKPLTLGKCCPLVQSLGQDLEGARIERSCLASCAESSKGPGRLQKGEGQS
jgi:hypothetical protein